jgi:radical SAM superfamily enzyme YgiQ (UPF0313 family)
LKKSALIVCLTSKNWYSFAPLLASLEMTDLLDKYQVFILEKRSNSAIKKILDQFETIIFAYSFHTPEVPAVAIEIIRIKEVFPSQNFLFIAGGPHASGNPKQTLQIGFNIVVKGEGESLFPLLLDRLWKSEPYFDLDGICVVSEGQFHITDSSHFIELDAHPTCSTLFGLHPPIEISRGCPFGCKYCQVSYLFGRKMRHRSIECILEIVKQDPVLHTFALFPLIPLHMALMEKLQIHRKSLNCCIPFHIHFLTLEFSSRPFPQRGALNLLRRQF